MADLDYRRKASSPLRLSTRSTLLEDTQSLRGSGRIIADLEKQHEESLARAYDRLQQSDDVHEHETQSLKTQVTVLRQQLASVAVANAAELKDLRTQFQAKLEAEARQRSATVAAANEKLAGAQQAWTEESDRGSRLRQELLTLQAHNTTEAAQAESTSRKLAQDLEYLKQHALTRLQAEIDRAKIDRRRTEEEAQRRVEMVQQQMQTEVNEWHSRLAAKEALVRNEEVEVADLRRQLQYKTESGERDVRGLQETLRSLRTVVELQEADLIRLRQAREDARRSAKQMSMEVTRLEKEMKRVDSENYLLKSSSSKLGRLVYGRTRRGSPKRAKRDTLERKQKMREAHMTHSSLLKVNTLERELNLITRDREKCEERNRLLVQESLETLNSFNEQVGGASLKRSKDRLLDAKRQFGNMVVTQYPQWAAAAENPIEFQKAVFSRALELAQAKKEEEEAALKKQLIAQQELAHSREAYLEWTKNNHLLRMQREKVTAQVLAEHQLYNSSFITMQKEMTRQMQTMGAEGSEAARQAMFDRLTHGVSPIQYERTDDSRPFTAGSVLPQMERAATPDATAQGYQPHLLTTPVPSVPQNYAPPAQVPQYPTPPVQSLFPQVSASQSPAYIAPTQPVSQPATQQYAPQAPPQVTSQPVSQPTVPAFQPVPVVQSVQPSPQPTIPSAPAVQPSVPAAQPVMTAQPTFAPPAVQPTVVQPVTTAQPTVQSSAPQSTVPVVRPTEVQPALQPKTVQPSEERNQEEMKVEVIHVKPVPQVVAKPREPAVSTKPKEEDEIQSSGEFDFEKFAGFGNRTGPPRNLGQEQRTKLESKGPAKKPAPGSMVFDQPAKPSDPRAEPKAKEVVIPPEENEDDLPIEVISSERGTVQEKRTDPQTILSGIPVVMAKKAAEPREEVKTPDPRVIGAKTKGGDRVILIEASDEDSVEPSQPEIVSKPLGEMRPKPVSPMFSPDSTQGIRMASPMSSTASLPLDKPQMKPVTTIVGSLKPNERMRILGELVRKTSDFFAKTRARLNPDYKPPDGRLEEIVKSFSINRPVSVKVVEDFVNAVLVIGYDLPYPFFPTEVLRRKKGFNEPEFLEAMSGEAQSIYSTVKDFFMEGVRNSWFPKDLAAQLFTNTLLNYRTSKSQLQRALTFVTSVLENRGRVTTSDLNSSFGDDRSQGRREQRSISPNRVDMRAPSPQDSRTFKSVKQALSIGSVSQKSGIDSFEEIADTE